MEAYTLATTLGVTLHIVCKIKVSTIKPPSFWTGTQNKKQGFRDPGYIIRKYRKFKIQSGLADLCRGLLAKKFGTW